MMATLATLVSLQLVRVAGVGDCHANSYSVSVSTRFSTLPRGHRLFELLNSIYEGTEFICGGYS